MTLSASEIVRLYVDELQSINAVAAKSHQTKQTIRNRLKHAGVTLRDRSEARARVSPHYAKWTPENDAKLRKLWGAGKTATTIANEIGCDLTKSAVTGRAHRMGLVKRPHIIKSATQRAAMLSQVAMSFGARPYRHRSLITFLPESPALEMQLRVEVAKARAERRLAL